MRCFLSALLTPYLYFRALSSGQRFVYSFFQDPSLSEPLAVQLCASCLTSFFDNPKLEELYIRGCSDISGLEKLSGLKVFSFWNADISDLSYISSLHKLNDLEVRTSNDLDCRNIDQLCELEKLEIFGDLLSNYQSIADLPKLSYLVSPQQASKIHGIPAGDMRSEYLSLFSRSAKASPPGGRCSLR